MFVAHFFQQPPKNLSALFKVSMSSSLELSEVCLAETVLEYTQHVQQLYFMRVDTNILEKILVLPIIALADVYL